MGAAAVSYLRSMLAELTYDGLPADALKSATTLDLADAYGTADFDLERPVE